MSLIEEALRKAQLERPSGRPASSVAVEDPPPRAVPLPRVRPVAHAPSAQPAPATAGLQPGLAAGAGLLVIGVLAWFWLGTRSSPRAPAPTSAAPVAAPRPVFRKQPPFQLTGVVGGPGEPLAIINGQIVKVGDAVAGAVLLEVGSNSARLRRGNEELVLTTSP